MKVKEEDTITDIGYAKIAHNRYLPQFFLFVITLSFITIIFLIAYLY
jgi:hypothetical protein